jgi:ubiquinone/menaquinone biosynthesis C-methylase UbiE
MGHNIDRERVYFTDKQIINLKDVKLRGSLLDIGGGGEGIIGQLYGKKVVAIDVSQRELEESPSDKPLKIVMDVCDLKFLDNEFYNATSFFTMMYLDSEEREKALSEIFRVLKPNGKFLLWDLEIPLYNNDEDKDIYAVPLKINFKDQVTEPRYGVRWPGSEQNISLYKELGKKIGFEVVEQENKGKTFFIKFKKLI